jgi:Zn ribbon nucleic-acid-binding protein
MSVHPMAFAMARSLPGEVALTLAVYPPGAVIISGVPQGELEMTMLRDAARAMTYTCPCCHEQRAVDEWSRDSVGLMLCVPCMEDAERENAEQDGRS